LCSDAEGTYARGPMRDDARLRHGPAEHRSCSTSADARTSLRTTETQFAPPDKGPGQPCRCAETYKGDRAPSPIPGSPGLRAERGGALHVTPLTYAK